MLRSYHQQLGEVGSRNVVRCKDISLPLHKKPGNLICLRDAEEPSVCYIDT